MGVLFAAVATMVVVYLAGLPLLLSLALGELVLLAWPLAVAKNLQLPWRALGLRRPHGRALVGAVLIGCTWWYVNIELVLLLRFDGGEHARVFATFVEQPSLATSLFLVAVMPALCEEVLFRGAVQRALASRLFPGAAIVLTSLLFAGFHMSLIQLVPTFTLGLLLGTLSLRADSIAPSMLAHFVNNAMAILITRFAATTFDAWIATHRVAMLTLCIATSALGILVARGARA